MQPRNSTSALLALALAAAMPAAMPVNAQVASPQDELVREVRRLQAGQEEMRKDLAEIKATLKSFHEALAAAAAQAGGEAKEPALDAVLKVAGEPFLGKVDAPITIFEFSDFE